MPDSQPPSRRPDREELQRQCQLLLDLADDELGTRRRCLKDGYASDNGDSEICDLETDLASIRPYIQNMPTTFALLHEAVDTWPQFNGDEPVSGADLVEWFAPWRNQIVQLLHSLPDDPAPDHPAIDQLLTRGFVVITRHKEDTGHAEYEAWAYKGPLDFDQAGSVCFGLGATISNALDALEHHLTHPPRQRSE
jgi:hypothetical protein